MRHRLEEICQAESVLGERVPKVLDRVMAVSNGDLRKAITYLQSTFAFYGSELDEHHIVQIAGIIPDAMVQSFLAAMKSNSFVVLERAVQDVLLEGFSSQQMIEQLFQFLLVDSSITDMQKSVILIRIADADKRLNDGCDEYLQLLSVASVAMQTLCA
jgi:replication factor C subunit 2/4